MVDYVENSDGLDEFYDRLPPLLDYLLPAYERRARRTSRSASAARAGATARW